MSGAGSGVRKMTNQSRLRILEEELKQRGATREFQTEGEIQSCNTGQYEKTDVISEH